MPTPQRRWLIAGYSVVLFIALLGLPTWISWVTGLVAAWLLTDLITDE